jgi:hypothetical protein
VLKVATNGFGKGFGEVAEAADVDGEVVFFGGAGQGEGVVLPDGYLWATEKDIL